MRTHAWAAGAAAMCWLMSACAPAFAQTCEAVPRPAFDAGLAPPTDAARVIHVSPPPPAGIGSNSTGNGTAAAPFATIARAVQALPPVPRPEGGYAIRLMPGTHTGGVFLSNLRGEPGAPIWLGGAWLSGEPGGAAPPVIAGGGTALQVSRTGHVVLHDIEISGATQNGVNFDDGGDLADENAARFVSFRRLVIHDVGTTGNQDGLKLSGVRDFTVEACDIRRPGAGGSGIDMVGCHRGTIARCVLAGPASTGVQAKGGTADIDILWNRFLNDGLAIGRAVNCGGSTGFEFFRPPLSTTAPNAEARRIRIIGNLFVGADAPVAFVGATDCLAAHNTIVNPGRWVLRILQETTTSAPYTFEPCARNQFVSNLVSFLDGPLSTTVNIGGGTDPASFVFANNLWYASDNPAASAPALPAPIPPQTGAVIGQNPLLANAAAGNYAVASTSPASGAGRAPAAVACDIARACFAHSPTIGAWEATPPANCCAADFNNAGGVSVQDVYDFLTAWISAAAGADFNGAGGVTVQDVYDFLSAWNAGCA